MLKKLTNHHPFCHTDITFQVKSAPSYKFSVVVFGPIFSNAPVTTFCGAYEVTIVVFTYVTLPAFYGLHNFDIDIWKKNKNKVLNDVNVFSITSNTTFTNMNSQNTVVKTDGLSASQIARVPLKPVRGTGTI